MLNLLKMVDSNLHGQPAYLEWLRRDLADCDSILELGCGKDSPLLKIGFGKKTFATDIWQPYVDYHNQRGDYKECWQADILTHNPIVRGWDAVVLCDVLEHLDRERVMAFNLFSELEWWARKKIIIFGPNGRIPNGISDNNPYQSHKSAWEPEDFLKRGYCVRGATGWRALLGEYGHPKAGGKLVELVALASQPFVYYKPKWAFQSYAVKLLHRV